MTLRFYGLLLLGVCLTGEALASDLLKTEPRLSIQKPYGHLLGSSKGEKLPMRTKAHIRKLAARLKMLRYGACVLFTGPGGSAKTMGAKVLGNSLRWDVFRVDVSSVISKYFGETEKNLTFVFKRAESKHWILFFDETDALFGKRSGINGAHDRYAKQETKYLLQLLEHHKGPVVLATNQRSNLDMVFQGRCRYEIKFP